tara:strand:+ start:2623 stop:3111 length:489 start_codon:yes stop_codon:yes gene_type:complete
MVKVKTVIEVNHYVKCPHCSKGEHLVSHLYNDKNTKIGFGPWYCDECGGAFKGEIVGEDVYIEKVEGMRVDKCIVFLKNANVLIAVEGLYRNGDLDLSHQRYFYDESTCPTNYLGVEWVMDLNDGEADPHGVFTFVHAIPMTDLDEINSIDDLNKIIPKELL